MCVSGLWQTENMPDRNTFLSMSDEMLARYCKLEFFKATGNGGQKRNKTSSAVRVTLEEYGVSAEDCSERSQHRNRASALNKLRRRIAYQLREEFVPFERRECSLEHAEYPLYMAKLLDLLFSCEWDYRVAAEKMGVSSSGMLKTIARDPELFTYYNNMRRSAGLPAVHT